MDSVRQAFPDAVQILENERQQWVYVPIAIEHCDVETFRFITQRMQPPIPVNAIAPQAGIKTATFFTDGGSLHPTDVNARLAAFAVVQDVSTEQMSFASMHSFAYCDQPRFPNFQVITSGIVPGSQTTARGELFAFLRALQAAQSLETDISVHFVTDALYVHDLVPKLQYGDPTQACIGTSNFDIVEQIIPLWEPTSFNIRKVKSHRPVESATSLQDLYDILGNSCADAAVTAVLQRSCHQLREISNQIACFHDQEKERLHKVCSYIIQLNRAKIAALDALPPPERQSAMRQDEPPTSQCIMPKNMMGQEAIHFLELF